MAQACHTRPPPARAGCGRGWLGAHAPLPAAADQCVPLPARVTQYLLIPKWLGGGLFTTGGSLPDSPPL